MCSRQPYRHLKLTYSKGRNSSMTFPSWSSKTISFFSSEVKWFGRLTTNRRRSANKKGLILHLTVREHGSIYIIFNFRIPRVRINRLPELLDEKADRPAICKLIANGILCVVDVSNCNELLTSPTTAVYTK